MNASRKLLQGLTADSASHASGRGGGHALATVSRARLEAFLLWLTFSISSIVWIEPAPFDFLCLILIGIWLTGGLAIPKQLRPLILMFAGLAATGLFGAFLSDEMVLSGRHVIISAFLYFLTIGIAAYVATDPEHTIPAIMNGYIVAALIAVAAGVAGYFSLFDGAYEIFTERDRARGTFKDPNVFGPFLVVPFVYIYLQHVSGRTRIGVVYTCFLAVLGLGLLLSFSRGAWVNLVLSLAIATYLLFVSSQSNTLRLRVLLLALVAIALVIVGLLFALSFDSISDMMNVRGKLLQSYDTQERFVGARIALRTILENPIGIGAPAFLKFHNVEPHNVYLYNFLIGGWLGGFLYIALVATTVVIGIKTALRKGPVRLLSILLVSTFLATALEGVIVDTDHWRHFYILMAGIWGVHCHQSGSGQPRLAPAPLRTETEGTTVERRRFARRAPLSTVSSSVMEHYSPEQKRSKTQNNFSVPVKAQNRLPRDFSLRSEARLRRQKQAAAIIDMRSSETRDEFGLRNSDPDVFRASFGKRR